MSHGGMAEMFKLPFIGYIDYEACLIIDRCN